MKCLVGMLIALLVMTVAVGAANAQLGVPDVPGHGSCFQVPIDVPAVGAPVMTFGPLGWDLFVSSHANRLVLALAQWRLTPSHATVAAHVRVSTVGNRVTH
jgi:hypothetical protein